MNDIIVISASGLATVLGDSDITASISGSNRQRSHQFRRRPQRSAHRLNRLDISDVSTGIMYVRGDQDTFMVNNTNITYEWCNESIAMLTIRDGNIVSGRGFDSDATINGLSDATTEVSGSVAVDGVSYRLSESIGTWSDGLMSMHGGAIYGLDEAEALTVSSAGIYTVNGSVLTVPAGGRVMGNTDWAGVHMMNTVENTTVKGTASNDYIINVADGATIDGDIGVDMVELLSNKREYVVVGEGSSVMADLFDYGYEATSDAVIFEAGELSSLTGRSSRATA